MVDRATRGGAVALRQRASVGIIVQARMTSKRLPGKTMMLLHGKPIIQHVIDNCLKIKPNNKKVIVAVPDTPQSEPILNFLVTQYKNKVHNFCGSEDNVLERYYQAAKFFGLDVIMRITADCPFINHKVCQEILSMHLLNEYDYTSNIYPKRTFPTGYDCEVFSFDCLEAAYLETEKHIKIYNKNSLMLSGVDNKKPMEDFTWYDAEHVTPWMQRHPDVIRGLIQQKEDHSNINLCVDTQEDLDRLEARKWSQNS